MHVSVLAYTAVNYSNLAGPGYRPHPISFRVTAADELAEMAGRLCYQAWERRNPSTQTNAGYLSNIIDHQHFSVLEHASVTFLIEDVSRSLTHELVRHRHFSYSQVSQRYVDSGAADRVTPPALWGDEGADEILADAFKEAIDTYEDLVLYLSEKGLTRKKAREAARAVLPNMTATSIVVTGNHRAWREFLAKRNTAHADAEIKELAELVLAELSIIAPNTYQDMVEVGE